MEEIIKHAIECMALMKFPDSIIEKFQQEEHSISLSYEQTIQPVPYLIHQQIKKIEKDYDVTVYHVTKTLTNFGICYECYCVSHIEYEWVDELEDAMNNSPQAYVINTTEPQNSEFGSVYVQVLTTYVKRVG